MTENKPVHDNTEIMSQEGNKNVFVSNSSPEYCFCIILLSFICLSYLTVIRIITIAFSPIFLVAFPNFIKTILGTFGDFKMRLE